MMIAVLLSLLAPISIYTGLIILKNVFITFFLFYGIVCILIPVIDYFVAQKRTVSRIIRDIGFNNLKGTWLFGLLLGAGYLAIILIFFSILHDSVLHAESICLLLKKWHLKEENLYIFLLLMIFANSIVEEIYWRGYIFSKLKGYTNISVVVFLTSFFYCSYHLITTIHLFSIVYGIIFTFIIFGAGLVCGGAPI